MHVQRSAARAKIRLLAFQLHMPRSAVLDGVLGLQVSGVEIKLEACGMVRAGGRMLGTATQYSTAGVPVMNCGIRRGYNMLAFPHAAWLQPTLTQHPVSPAEEHPRRIGVFRQFDGLGQQKLTCCFTMLVLWF